jgi:site-specific DNA-methyltransferase (adenine-specific)
MNPYYDQDGITILHGDALDILPMLEPGSFDVVIADPNYGETSFGWDQRSSEWPKLILPLLLPHGTLWSFGSLRYFVEGSRAFVDDWTLVQEIVWEKHNGSGFHNDRFRRVHELLTHWRPRSSKWIDIYKNPQFTMDATARTIRHKQRPAHWTGARGAYSYESTDGGPRLMRSVQFVRSCHGSAVHATQKPEEIVRPALAYSCPPGGIVLSPFMGSGTDLVVARALGFRAIGIEEHEEDCEIAVRRLEMVSQETGGSR